MSKKIWIPITLMLIIVGSLFWYYHDRFGPVSMIGDLDVSGQSYESAEILLKEKLEDKEVVVLEDDDIIFSKPLKDFGSFNTTNILNQAWDRREPGLLFHTQLDPVESTFVIGDDVSPSTLGKDLQINNSMRPAAQDAYINESTFEIVPEVPGRVVDLDQLYADFKSGTYQLDLSDYYVQPEMTADSDRLLSAKRHLDDILGHQPTLVIKEHEVAVPKELIEAGLLYDSASHRIRFESSVLVDWLEQLNEEIAPYGKPFTFNSTLQGEVEVPAGTLGWVIEKSETFSDLNDAILKKEEIVEATLYDDNYDTDNYVEVDLDHQKMFIYRDGELALETDIVSGMAEASPPTPTIPGAYQVWDKQSPSVLTGVNQQLQTEYAQPVDYWLPFDLIGQGIHDANWQGAFGGDVYLYAGSQGCINTPPSIMPTVFELVDVGFPVLVH